MKEIGEYSMIRRPLIIDTDPGIDDAMMLTVAFANKDIFDIRLVTTASGNISQSKANYNAHAFLNYIKEDVTIARGLEQPMFRKLEVAEEIHGAFGFGKVEFPKVEVPENVRPAVAAMRETILASEEKVTIVATGPLTNVGALLLAHPEVKDHIETISWMGGAAQGGNKTAVAEFNAFVDPHAAQIVMQSGVPMSMCGLDVTHKAFVTQTEAKKILDIGTEFAQKAYDLVTYYLDVAKPTPFSEPHYADVLRFHDVSAIMYLLHPEFFKGTDYYVEMSTEGITAGATVVDLYNSTGNKPNVHVLHDVDREAFVKVFMGAVRTISDRLS
ncbi:Pyrimidine-specific ribonucleoside hydrolase rihA [Solibacillus isronensis B3W22]|uniref:Pyrimidine-specific ribonucleoside hydrolase rihA n=2 Tax=Solibacillus isronensis TaxID=412383 RepID=K1KNH7_9BACL|nr:ribosylpyrimidine nucleosidase [Solibacillus silvestris]EKB45670.1 Pyrimidine-specific ribonucleoside hydrolase rihA [Solibacillus isronensis B3W22]